MQENAKWSRETYIVPKGEEQDVHYTCEVITRNNVTGVKTSQPRLVKTPVKLFEQIKRVLELQGNTIHILYHPQGKYPVEVEEEENAIVAQKEAEIRALKAKLEEKSNESIDEALKAKDEEIEALKAELAKAKKNEEKETPKVAPRERRK